ncbi:MAG TPA: 1-deoxy-D-xylulose-5-phosphate reductoisomerase [Actinomycetota bacterium]|nr:1-deoxy-D-xylulose-5-phosphate reductoisomerase [Actinomycetota bacterium]
MTSAGLRRVVILGSTGSIGRQALEVIAEHPDELRVVGLAAGSDADGLAEQSRRFGVDHTGLGEDASVELASGDDTDIVLNAIVGAAGLRASVAALEAGKTLALANKESLVAGGEVCEAAASRGGGRVVPVDSEHAAIAQCLRDREPREVTGMVLTASGGPFRTRAELSDVTPEEALAHPTWSMGPKITIDSATLMNKGLEAIEAHHLFGFDYDEISVLVHPQSIVHGIVELRDGSLVMHAAAADMRIPIQMALMTDGGSASNFAALDLSAADSLEFEELDRAKFPAVGLAYQAGRAGRSYPAALNAANEVAVHAFLDRRLSFTDIPRVVESVLDDHDPIEADDLDAVLEVDRRSRADAQRIAEERSATLTGGRQ